MEPKQTTPRADYEWSEERSEKAARLFVTGISSDEIAEELGCTRNAVIGKMNRMGIVSPNKPGQRRGEPAKKRAAKPATTRPNMQTINARAARTQDQPPTLPVERHIPRQYVAHEATRKTLQGLADSDCRWPCGDPGHPDFWFCGAPMGSARPYCNQHARIAYRA